jgi:hypothetical protein
VSLALERLHEAAERVAGELPEIGEDAPAAILRYRTKLFFDFVVNDYAPVHVPTLPESPAPDPSRDDVFLHGFDAHGKAHQVVANAHALSSTRCLGEISRCELITG